MKKIVLTFGLIAGAILSVMMMITLPFHDVIGFDWGMVVGYTTESVALQLSRLMAFDARALGTWGCAPELYPEIVDLVLAGTIDVVGTTELRPLAGIADAFADMRTHRASRRIVLVPDLEAP